MAQFQHMNDTKVDSPIVTVTGSTVNLKVIPGAKEALPTITASPVTVAKVMNVKPHVRADFSTFELLAVAKGSATLVATDATKKNVTGPIDITVEDPVSLPSDATDEGLLARLFIAEVPSPEDKRYNLADAKTSMIWMRVVVENRLKKPDVKWASAGAKSLQDVIRAPVQFEGFPSYPTLIKRIRDLIADTISIANNGNDTRRAEYKAFVDAALEVAAMKSVTDPSPKGLFWWMTSGMGTPGNDAEVFMRKLGNTFFSPK
ncbi:MAG TPA: hypothetical protein VGL53_29505 [Bryobacteraceae bacterium]|jgi:hypothetical protein